MVAYMSLQDRFNNSIEEITNKVNRSNVKIAVPLLEWVSEKIDLAYNESVRINQCQASKRMTHMPLVLTRGGVYYAKLGQNIGSEQNGYRPVLIVQSSQGNATSNTVVVIPLTDFYDKNGKPKRVFGTHVEIDAPALKKKSIIKAEHIMNISKNRIVSNKICSLTNSKTLEVNQKIKVALGI